jgi:hypothetical protein
VAAADVSAAPVVSSWLATIMQPRFVGPWLPAEVGGGAVTRDVREGCGPVGGLQSNRW